MSTIHICDGCKKVIKPLDSVSFMGSKKLRGTIFCENCFKIVEKYIITKYNLVGEDYVNKGR
ncbi:hypothetical protein A3J17_02310 [Candidatus Curtissbacteria bacterium RIFCSPLOWO2_02_FULL_40_11]|uniref:Uncharacterized protein n=2 Tax=Candidatus Curtissiibacteriota TaxID=1752717 RepID=A0A1F5G9A5_9BACT|nr:MAG: hypothetical protein A3D04_00895 [Candidatus Curtissbacteria bacterium RIFCSPHIGHO2_02_FULL_40_16b]OGD99601.1 MAG: hypothetical protein A3J17_02310 [Candidatus Curtissbacteria bacterium RIFCSPLOWO2_02_FULL_40_11]OGE14120.1 MAG: hypothetical protein A3G14_01500 [Candidatus Curtissbacteria bacterium RIFCSPLOWO2_12_FULL_38_9]